MKTRARIACASALAALVLLPGCEAVATQPLDDLDPTRVPAGDRLLGVAISDRSDGDFNEAFAEAVAAGMRVTSLSLAWNDLEVAPGVYDPAIDYLGIAAGYYPPRGTRLLLSINPIDTNRSRLPEWLEGRAWDDPLVIEAFEGLLAWAMERASPLDLVALAIGNEIDASLASDAQWEAYRRFHLQVSAHARTLRPGLRVGAKITAAGLRGAFADQAAALSEASGLVLTTYYPLESDFTIAPPSVVGGVFDDIVARAGTLPVLFAEIGAPSTSRCGSSEALQADFVSRAFEAWDRYADRIELLEFVWMHDIDEAALERYEAYYGLSNPCFLDYLATLGLQSADGADKPAWTRLVQEATDRGW